MTSFYVCDVITFTRKFLWSVLKRQTTICAKFELPLSLKRMMPFWQKKVC